MTKVSERKPRAATGNVKWNARQQAVIDEVVKFRRDGVLTVAAGRASRVDSEQEAYAIQDWVSAHLAQPVAGWKVGAFFDDSVRLMLGLEQPFSGRVFQSTVHRSPATLEPRRFPGCHLEAELALELSEDIDAHDAPVTSAGLAALISACYPVFEVVTSSWDDRRALTGFDHVADNGGCGGLVVGEPIPSWREIELRGQTVELEIGGRIVASSAITLDWERVLDAATWLINTLKLRGIGVRAGEIIATGTLTGLNAVAPGELAVASFGGSAKFRCRSPTP